ncbi:MAG TPA: hypothetical protein VJR30_22585 [Bradyrhizobium sp.]|nr:hypothetical protein [Bradyrhizobium sp.]
MFVIVENFSQRGIGCCETAVHVLGLHGATSIRKRRFLRAWIGRAAKMPLRSQSSTEKKIVSRGQRVLDGLSGAGVWNWAEKEPEWFADTESLEKCIWFNAEMIP